MRFRLLGELQVESGGRVLRIRGGRLRSLLACLLVNRNQALSRDRLLDAVWGARLPPSGSHGLEVLVSQLRRQLGPEARSRIETTPGGYRLRVAAEEFDLDRFERQFAAGRRALVDGDPDAAIEHLRGGLDEWRGQAFGELVYMPCFADEAARLEELRLDALEAVFEAELARGGQEDLVSEIEAFLAANPLREHARGQLMRALYRCGRQADALEVYRVGYGLLAELGLEPGDELRHIQTSILQRDPVLVRLDQKPADLPVTRYVRSHGVAIAYQASGEGPYDIVWVPSFVTNVELNWQVPRRAEFCKGLGSFSRLIRYDRRGTGMSDRVNIGDLATGTEDALAVMDAALSTEAAIIAASYAGPLAIHYAITHPERVWALVLFATGARIASAEDYPYGMPPSDFERDVTECERIWIEPGYAEASARSVGATDAQELASMWRQSGTPAVVRALGQDYFRGDVRNELPLVRVPTLVLNREGDSHHGLAAGCRYLAEHIAGARHVVFPGTDHLIFADGNSGPVLPEIKAFLDTAWAEHITPSHEGRRRSRSPAAAVENGLVLEAHGTIRARR